MAAEWQSECHVHGRLPYTKTCAESDVIAVERPCNHTIATSNLHAELRFRNPLSQRKVGIRPGTESEGKLLLLAAGDWRKAPAARQTYFVKSTNAIAGAVALTVTVIWRSGNFGFLKTTSCVPSGTRSAAIGVSPTLFPFIQTS